MTDKAKSSTKRSPKRLDSHALKKVVGGMADPCQAAERECAMLGGTWNAADCSCGL